MAKKGGLDESAMIDELKLLWIADVRVVTK